MQNGQHFRLVGDNINFKTGVRHEREDHHGGTRHWFGSAAIVQNLKFDDMSDVPQGLVKDLTMEQIIPSDIEELGLKKRYITLIMRTVMDHIPFMKKFNGLYQKEFPSEHAEDLKKPNLVVPLEVLPYNEAAYPQVCKILLSYVDTIDSIYESENHRQVHIGGDQLTRERFSGAKGLKDGSFDYRKKLTDLYPISFEMWHTGMNFLTAIFQILFNEDSVEPGTLNGEKIRINRHDVHEDVKNNYDPDKEFFLSFCKAYLVEAICDFFGMENTKSVPTKHIPPTHVTQDWFQDTMLQFVDNYILSKKETAMAMTEIVEETRHPVEVRIGPNQVKTIYILRRTKKKVLQPVQTDHVQQYSKVCDSNNSLSQLLILFLRGGNLSDIIF